ncbi:MAG: hypothetical protein JXB39_03820 [Deltaproteobacteria bacterium]|nr:hypothetical protein [Deltaproteobacteria bacterium]
MPVQNDEPFIQRVESLIEPGEVCDLFFIQRFKKLMPNVLFKRLLYETSRRYPQIGFVIEPYSLFLFFRLKDLDRAKSLLPARYELVKSRIVEGDEPDHYHGMGIFNTRGSTFWGTRLESYLIARDKETGLVSWIFIDIFSNTLIALPKAGVADPNSHGAVYTTSSKGDFFVNIAEDGTGRRLKLRGTLSRGQRKVPDKPLWIGGNTSIAYTEKLSGGDETPFAVIFDPAEVATALEIPVEDVKLEENGLMPGLAEPELCKVLCFPFAQHYIADSPGCRTFVKDEEDMVAKVHAIAERTQMETFSTRGVKRLFLAGFLLFALLSLGVLAALIAVLVS